MLNAIQQGGRQGGRQGGLSVPEGKEERQGLQHARIQSDNPLRAQLERQGGWILGNGEISCDRIFASVWQVPVSQSYLANAELPNALLGNSLLGNGSLGNDLLGNGELETVQMLESAKQHHSHSNSTTLIMNPSPGTTMALAMPSVGDHSSSFVKV